MFKQYLLLLVISGLVFAGCASSSGASDESSSGSDEVSGQPPSHEEDTPKALPKGPEVDVGSAKVEPSEQTGAEQDAQAQAVVSKAELKRFIDKGATFALQQVRVKPSRVDGEFQGFELVKWTQAAKEAVSPQLGLGDVITHINGVRIERPDDYLTAWKLLDEIGTIRVDFIRKGEPRHATWRVQ